jgi:hypothetical protein
MTRGRPIRGLFGGFLLGICIDLDLIFGGVVTMDSPVLTILPLVLTVVGFGLGLWAPLGRTHEAPAALPGHVLPPPVAWPDYAPAEGSTPPPPFGSNLGGESPPPPPAPPASPI